MTNKTKITIASIAVGVPLLGYMAYRYALANYSFKPTGVSINGGNWYEDYIDLDIMLELTSRIGIGFVVKDIELDVKLQGVTIGHISKSDNIVVPSNGTTTIAIPLHVDLTKVKSNAIGIITSAITGGGVQVEIDGYSKAFISGIPLGINVSVNEKIDVV